MTKNGVERDLIKSPYFLTYNGTTYFFSSMLHLNKFKSTRIDNKDKILSSLFKRFKIKLNIPIVYDIILYQKIETRGFLIFRKGRYFSCVKNIILDGETVTLN